MSDQPSNSYFLNYQVSYEDSHGGDQLGIDVLLPDIFGTSVHFGGDILATNAVVFGNSIAFQYIQRVYDNVLGEYVYYKLSSVTPTPGSSQTNPNHSGVSNLDTNRHEIMATITDFI